MVTLPSLRTQLQASVKRTDMLLLMLGEREEELEGLLSDMREVKTMYQGHMQELMLQVAPEQPIAAVAVASGQGQGRGRGGEGRIEGEVEGVGS